METFRIDPQEGEEKARENIESLNAEIQTMTKTIEEYIAGAEDISLMEARKAKEELVMQVQNLKEEAKILRTEAGEHSQQIDTLRGRGDELEGNNSREVLNSRVTPVSHLNLRSRVAICRNCHNT